MAGFAEPCSPEPISGSCTAELAAVEWVLPVLRDVLKKELRELRELKPSHDSLAARLDAASQENAAQFETLREIVKRLSTSLRDKAEVAEVVSLVERQCCDRLDALETFCNDLGARVGSFHEECRKTNIGPAHAMPKEADSAGGLALGSWPMKDQAAGGDYDEKSSVKRFCIDSGRGDPPCDDPSQDGTSEFHFMRYESELEQLRSMIIEGQSVTEQLHAALVREHETGVSERARLDGLQKTLADNVVTLSRTHGTVGERLQQMQNMLDNVTHMVMGKLHSSSTEAAVGESTTQGLEALQHRLEKIEMSLKNEQALICERQDNMENMVSEENRRIWMAMETHHGSVAMSVTPSPLNSGRLQQAGSNSGNTATATLPLSAIAAVALPSASVSQPAPPQNLGNSAKMVPCSRTGTPTPSSPRRLLASSILPATPNAGTSATPAPQAASPRQCGSGASPALQILTMSAETTGSGAATPIRCTSPVPVVTPTHSVATPPRCGSPPPRSVRVGSPLRTTTPVLASRPPRQTANSPSPTRKQTARLPGGSLMVPPGALNHRSPAGSPVMPHRNIPSRNRGGTPNNSVAVHRRRQQEQGSRPSWPFEFGGSPRMKGQ